MGEDTSNLPAVDQRRRVLVATTALIGGAGVVAVAVPFISAWNPSARARSAGAPVEVDISNLEWGQQITVKWRGKPVWVLRRAPQMLKDLRSAGLLGSLRDPDSTVVTQQPDYAKNQYRSIKSEYFVVIGICTHLGCVPTFRPDHAPPDLGKDWVGGYYCPCHGSRFDLAGRVFKGVPAPTNLVVPRYQYLSDFLIQIGEDAVVS